MVSAADQVAAVGKAAKSRSVKQALPALSAVGQALVAKEFPQGQLSALIAALKGLTAQSQDVQLKVLQLLPLIYSSGLQVSGDDLFDSLSIPVSLLDTTGIVRSVSSATLQQLVTISFDNGIPEAQIILQEICRIAEGNETKVARLKGIKAQLALELLEDLVDGKDQMMISKTVVPFARDFLKRPSPNFSTCVHVARIVKKLMSQLLDSVLDAVAQPSSMQVLLLEVLVDIAPELKVENHQALTSKLLNFEHDIPALGTYTQALPAQQDAEVNSEGLVFEASTKPGGLGAWLLPDRKLLASSPPETPRLEHYPVMLMYAIVTTLSQRPSPAWRDLLRLNSALLSGNISDTMERTCIDNLTSMTVRQTGTAEASVLARNACLKRLGRLAVSAASGSHMTARSFRCLEAFLDTATKVWTSFDVSSWSMVLDIIRVAEPLLDVKRHSTADGDGQRRDVQSNSRLLQGVQTFFESSQTLPEDAFVTMLQALLVTDETELTLTTPLASPTFLRQRLLSTTSFGGAPSPSPSTNDEFTLNKLAIICQSNLDRFSQDAQDGWSLVRSFLAAEIESADSVLAAETLGTVIRNALSGSTSAHQDRFLEAINDLQGRNLLIKTEQVETVAFAVQLVGHDLSSWGLVLNVLHGAVQTAEAALPPSVPSTPMTARSFSDHFPESSERSKSSVIANLVRSAFASLELICSEYLSNLPKEHIPKLLDIVLVCCLQTADLNISLSSVSLLWMIVDSLERPADLATDTLWQAVFAALIQIAHHDQREVRHSAIYTLFRILDVKLLRLGPEVWSIGSSQLLEPVTSTEDAETLCLIIGSATRMMTNALVPLSGSPLLKERWESHIQLLALAAKREGATVVAIQSFAHLHNHVIEADVPREVKQTIAHIETPHWLDVGQTLTSTGLYAQEVLVKYIDSLRSLAIRTEDDQILTRVATILRAALVYRLSPSYLFDLDHPSALQKSILSTWEILLERLPQRRMLLLTSLSSTIDVALLTPDERSAYSIRRPSTASSWDGVPTFVAYTEKVLQLLERYYDASSDTDKQCTALCLAHLNRYIECRFEVVSPRDAANRHPLWQSSLKLAFTLLDEACKSGMTDALWSAASTLAAHLFMPVEGQSEELVLTFLNRLRALLVPAIGDAVVAHQQEYCEALYTGSFFDYETPKGVVIYDDRVLREWCLLELLRMSTLCAADGDDPRLETCGELAIPFAVRRGQGMLERLTAAFPISGHAPLKEADLHALMILLEHLADPEVVSVHRPRVRALCQACWLGLVQCLAHCAKSETPRGLVAGIEEALIQIGKLCF